MAPTALDGVRVLDLTSEMGHYGRQAARRPRRRRDQGRTARRRPRARAGAGQRAQLASVICRGMLEAFVDAIAVTDSDNRDLSHAWAGPEDDPVVALADSEQRLIRDHGNGVASVRIVRHLAQCSAQTTLRLGRERLELGLGLVRPDDSIAQGGQSSGSSGSKTTPPPAVTSASARSDNSQRRSSASAVRPGSSNS